MIRPERLIINPEVEPLFRTSAEGARTPTNTGSRRRSRSFTLPPNRGMKVPRNAPYNIRSGCETRRLSHLEEANVATIFGSMQLQP